MTEFEKFCYVFLIICGVILAAGFSWRLGEKKGYRKGYAEALSVLSQKVDTVWRTDTLFIDRPVEVWREREKLVYLPVHDTSLVVIRDTAYIALERERRGYSGDEYEAVVSGIDPLLESIKVFPKTAYVTNTVIRRKHWGFGATAGPGVLYDGKIHGGVGIVAGLQYQF